MDLQQQWSNMQSKLLNESIDVDNIKNAINSESKSLIMELKYRVKIKMMWVAFFLLLSVVFGLMSFGNFYYLMLSAVVFTYMLVAILFIYHNYKNIADDNFLHKNLLIVLKRNLKSVKSVIKSEERVSFIFLPFLVVTSMIGGFKLSSGWGIVTIVTSKVFLVSVPILLILSVFLVWFLGDKMNNYAFGGHIIKLEENINKLEMLKG